MTKATYRSAGVDMGEGDRLVELIKPHAARTKRPGMAPVCSLGFGTPSSIVRMIDSTLPSPHSHFPEVRSEPTDEPVPAPP